MTPSGRLERGVRLTARLRLTLSYVLFLLLAGLAMSVIVYAVIRFVPNYPLTAANPSDLHLPIASRGEILDAVVRASAIALGVLAVVGTWGGWLIAGRVLRPLADLNEAARAAAAGNLSHRIALRGRRDEFTDLADTFDAMLERLEHAFVAQQRFAANASHELRTPLAVTQAMLEVARDDPDAVDLPQLLDRLDETNRRGTDLVTALLQLSALDRAPITVQPVALDVLVEDAVDDALREASARGVRVEVVTTPVTVPGDEPLLLRLVDNLLRNALRHNLPTGGWASVQVERGDDAVLTVENSGEVLSDETLRTAVEPFVRGAGRVASRPGHGHDVGARGSNGLGLALVSRIVEAHGGRIELRAREAGGAVVRVVLPRLGRPEPR